MAGKTRILCDHPINFTEYSAWHAVENRRMLEPRELLPKMVPWHAVLWRTSMASKERFIIRSQVRSRKGHGSLRLRAGARRRAR